jgi:DNA-binding protein YbaB
MGIFDDTKKLLKIRKEAKEIQKKLKNIHIEADEDNVTITISAEQEVVKVEIKDETIDAGMKKKLESNLLSAFNKAIKKSQAVAAENMKGILGELGGGLGGLTAPETDK